MIHERLMEKASLETDYLYLAVIKAGEQGRNRT